MENKYGIRSAESKELVWNPFFSQKLTDDIDWAQHMGSDFREKYIYEALYYPRKANLTLNH